MGAVTALETAALGERDARGRLRRRRGILKEALALVHALNRLVTWLTKQYVRHVERWLQARSQVVRVVWRIIFSPILLLMALRKPLTEFYEAVGNEVWPWVLAWSGWQCD